MLGYQLYGSGVNKVLVMHDWFCDNGSYAAILPFLNTTAFTYVFMDLRGYGKSKSIQGEFSLNEATQDAIALADHLHWSKFHIISHSMSAMVAQHIALNAESRVNSVIAITPVPACGSPIDKEVLVFLENAANGNDQNAEQIIGMMTSNKLTANFANYKVKQWRETSVASARIAYLHMFAHTNFAEKIKGLATPFLVIIGGHDADGYSQFVMQETFLKWYPNAQLAIIPNAGHYPMQETPFYLLNLMEEFLLVKDYPFNFLSSQIN